MAATADAEKGRKDANAPHAPHNGEGGHVEGDAGGGLEQRAVNLKKSGKCAGAGEQTGWGERKGRSKGRNEREGNDAQTYAATAADNVAGSARGLDDNCLWFISRGRA